MKEVSKMKTAITALMLALMAMAGLSPTDALGAANEDHWTGPEIEQTEALVEVHTGPRDGAEPQTQTVQGTPSELDSEIAALVMTLKAARERGDEHEQG